MKKYLIIIILLIFMQTQKVFAQGCIAVRSMGCGAVGVNNPSSFMSKGDFQFSASYRFLHSYKHFVGSVEQKERVENKTNVINDTHNLDLNLNYGFSDKINFGINIPLVTNDRSSLYEHYGNSLTANPAQLRFNTQSRGVGDVRLSGAWWILDQQKHHNANINVGLGIKMPTGNANVSDQFHKLTVDKRDTLITRYVDQSIQLGDSGWGYSIESQGYTMLGIKSSVFYSAFYLFSPKNINPVTNLSVPDQYGVRLGISTPLWYTKGLTFTLVSRLEGLPSSDLIGKSEGSRRPGFILSVEPGLIWIKNQHLINVSIPYALVRNRTRSFVDKQDPSGLRHGDAAFADYLINVNYTCRIGAKKQAD